MAQSQRDSGWIYQCDDIVVEPRAHRLERAGVALAVEPKAYTVLVVLLQQAGEVVSRDDLLDAAWGHRHVTPGVLTRVISQLRHTLGDCAEHPRYIATIHSLGYRFIGQVRRITAPPASHADVGATAHFPTLPPPMRPSRHLGMPWLAAAIAVAAIAAMLAAASLWHAPATGSGEPHASPQPALVVLPVVRADHGAAPKHWPRSRRIATIYRSPLQREGGGYLSVREDQAPAARD